MTDKYAPIPDHAAALRQALLELAHSCWAGKPGPPASPYANQAEALARAIQNDLATAAGQAKWAAVINDRVDSVSLPVGVVLRLIVDAAALPAAKRQLADSEREANACWERVYSAHRIMQDHNVDYEKRSRKVLFELGITGEDGGKGKARVDHAVIADHYYALRCGEPNVLWDGEILPPHSHNDAVRIIEERYGLDWDSLRKAWRRKSIQVSIDAEVFPIK